MRRLICTCNVHTLAYEAYTLPSMQRYAQRMDADLRVMRDFPAYELYGSPYWTKLQVIKDFAMQDRWDHLLYLDLDVVIMPDCADLFELAGDRIGVVQDMGIPHVDEGFRHWCRRHFSQEPVVGDYFNVGVLVIPLLAARRMLSHFHGPFPEDWPPDQNYLNFHLSRNEPLCWMPPEYNWLAPTTAPGPGPKILHFCGDQKRHLPSYPLP